MENYTEQIRNELNDYGVATYNFALLDSTGIIYLTQNYEVNINSTNDFTLIHSPYIYHIDSDSMDHTDDYASTIAVVDVFEDLVMLLNQLGLVDLTHASIDKKEIFNTCSKYNYGK